MSQAGIITSVLERFMEHPGILIFLFVFAIIQHYLYNRKFWPHSLTIFFAVGVAIFFLALVSPSLFTNALDYFARK